MTRYRGTIDVFFGIEHRMRKEEKEEQFNKESKQGDAARITDEHASSGDRKHTSRGVLVAVNSNLGPVVSEEEGAVTLIPGKERQNCLSVG